MTTEMTTIDAHQQNVFAEDEALFWGFVNKYKPALKQLASKEGLSFDEYVARRKGLIGVLVATQDLSSEGLSEWVTGLRDRIGDGRGWDTGTLGRCYMAANPETRQVWVWAAGDGWSSHTLPVNWKDEGF